MDTLDMLTMGGKILTLMVGVATIIIFLKNKFVE